MLNSRTMYIHQVYAKTGAKTRPFDSLLSQTQPHKQSLGYLTSAVYSDDRVFVYSWAKRESEGLCVTPAIRQRFNIIQRR
jgi:hypothetical protein